MNRNKLVLLAIMLLAFSFSSGASERHHEHSSITYNIETYAGASLGVAMSQQQFDLSSDRWQATASYGNVESDSSISVGIAKGHNGLLINGSIAQTLNGSKELRAIGIGISGKF